MTDMDDEVLAYAMALGRHFKLFDPLPGKSKRVRYREVTLGARSLTASGYADRSDLAAHFVVRLMSHRSVKVAKSPDLSLSAWVIADGRAGLQLRFEAPAEKQVRTRMAEASLVEVDDDLEPVEAARQRLCAVIEEREQGIVASRAKETLSKKDRVVELMKGADGFRLSRLVNQSYGFTEFKSSNAATVKTKLNDPSLFISQIDVQPHDHPLAVEWDLQPGHTLVEVEFCKVKDMPTTPASVFRWFAPAETPEPSKKPSLPKSKRASG
jgi:hypothetical protein